MVLLYFQNHIIITNTQKQKRFRGNCSILMILHAKIFKIILITKAVASMRLNALLISGRICLQSPYLKATRA